MSNFAIFDNVNSPNPVLQYLENQDDPFFINRLDALRNPNLTAVNGLSQIYWKVQPPDHILGLVVPMTAQEQANVDAAIAAVILASQRSEGISTVDTKEGIGKVLRALADISLSEINILREWIVSFKAATSAAVSLADFKTRVAALPDLPDRTLAQLRTAIKNDINLGNVDS